MKLRPGKVPWELVSRGQQAALPPEVVLGPGWGEDAAAVRVGQETWVVASDPITFAAPDAGRLCVIVNANDVAVRGAEPRFFLPVVLLSPNEASESRVDEVLGQIREQCDRLGVAVIGGHSEVTEGIDQSIVVGTMIGRVDERLITTGGVEVGDHVGMVRWAGLEGTAILASELDEALRRENQSQLLEGLDDVLSGEWLGVWEAANALSGVEGLHAMHDVTEGGVGEALHELAAAGGLELEILRDEIPILQQTRGMCKLLGISPLGLIGSGGLLLACAADACDEVTARISEIGLRMSWIGRAISSDRVCGGIERFPRDELVKVLGMQGIDAVLFDMDGTLIRSEYDWPAIRERLGITQDSIIDELNGLAEPERSRKWKVLESMERVATENAGLIEGAEALLVDAKTIGLKTALVTNNNQANTDFLLRRFDLRFDLVLTRDSGLWKPSGEILQVAAQKLDTPIDRCLAVGDSRYDLAAARDAGCGLACMVFDAAGKFAEAADLRFADLPALARALRILRG